MIADYMVKNSVDSKLKRHKVFFTLTFTPTIVIVAFFLLILPIDGFIAVVTMAIIDVSALLSIQTLNWTARRRIAKIKE